MISTSVHLDGTWLRAHLDCEGSFGNRERSRPDQKGIEMSGSTCGSRPRPRERSRPDENGIETDRTNSRWQSLCCGSVPPDEKRIDRKSTRLNSSPLGISYAVFC